MIKDYSSIKIGIIGGGQLGKMMIMEATKMGIPAIVLDPEAECPAKTLATGSIKASFSDRTALLELAQQTDVLTCEFEHISVEALRYLEEKGHTVYPKSEVLRIIQNKYEQKMVLLKHNIPLGSFHKVEGMMSIIEIGNEYGYPMMLKSSLGGYDGKGNFLIKTREDVETGYKSLNGDHNPLYIEKYIPFAKEISVLCCRGQNDDIVVYPVAENNHQDSILSETIVPALITKEEEKKAMDIAFDVCKIFDTVGIICIEMFLTKSGEILVNEVAPRPHNSGHYTIEGCVASQYENHIRAVVGLPLGSTRLIQPTVMRNILGEQGYEGEAIVEGASNALAIEGVSLHIYGKKETRYQRKMGHLTAVAQELEVARENAKSAFINIKIKSKGR